MSENFDKIREICYKFHITYNDPNDKNNFVRGHNVTLDDDCMVTAINQFKETFENVEILGILKSEIEK